MESHFVAISAVVVCSALLAWLAARSRQPIILGYFLCGVLAGSVPLRLVSQIEFLENISRVGVTLLLFLAGLVLHPDRLAKFSRTAGAVVLGGCGLMWLLVFAFLRLWGYGTVECHIAGLALMFSSTILVVKLLPTTTLRQKRMWSICIAILIAEDLVAIVLLMFVGAARQVSLWQLLLGIHARGIVLIALAVIVERYVVRNMMRTVDRFNEVLIMLCLAWGLGMAVLAEGVGLSYEIGAFIAGVTMARGKIALVLSEQLKPLRDFFLMFFFFVLGARFDLMALRSIWLPALLLGLLIVAVRPIVLRRLFGLVGEAPDFSREMGFRLGPASEFALIVAVAASQSGRLSGEMSQLIQFTTILTMLVSSYIVVLRYPTPIGVRADLFRD